MPNFRNSLLLSIILTHWLYFIAGKTVDKVGQSKCWIAKKQKRTGNLPLQTFVEHKLVSRRFSSFQRGSTPRLAAHIHLEEQLWTNSRKFHRVVKNVKNVPSQTGSIVRLSALLEYFLHENKFVTNTSFTALFNFVFWSYFVHIHE